MSNPPPTIWLGIVALLSLLPLAAIFRQRRGQPEALRFSPGRSMLFYAIWFSAGLVSLRLLGVPGLMALVGLGLGFLGSKRGVAPAYRFLFGPAIDRHPHLVPRDAGAMHLFMLIAAVLCFTVGIVFATWPGVPAAG